jgi:hypothetical protein
MISEGAHHTSRARMLFLTILIITARLLIKRLIIQLI